MKEHSLELLISKTLRAGITVAATLGLLGGALYLVSYGQHGVAFASFRGTSSVFLSPVEVLRTIAGAHKAESGERALAIAQLGILVLLATPVIRVAFSIIGFALERDRIYVLITSVVLTTLLVSAFLL